MAQGEQQLKSYALQQQQTRYAMQSLLHQSYQLLCDDDEVLHLLHHLQLLQHQHQHHHHFDVPLLQQQSTPIHLQHLQEPMQEVGHRLRRHYFQMQRLLQRMLQRLLLRLMLVQRLHLLLLLLHLKLQDNGKEAGQ